MCESARSREVSMRRRFGRLAALAAAFVISCAAPAAATSLPFVYSFGAGITAELLTPGASPPGANDWSCHPTTSHPRPVVLVHGTFGDMTDSWQALSPLLKN